MAQQYTTLKYITLDQSNVRNRPINASRAPEVGDILAFTGKVKVVEFNHRMVELLVFTDQITGDEVTMNVSTLMHAHGTVRLFFKNFSYVGEAMERAISAKVLFCVNDIETHEREIPGGTVRLKTLTIDCEN